MSLTRFQPFFADPFFDDRFWALAGPQSRSFKENMNAMTKPMLHTDVIERDGDYQIHVDLPGYDKKDVELTVANGALHIKAERKQSHEEKTEFSHKIERSYGSAQRTIPLPENAMSESAEANFDNGVLTVQFTKRPALEAAKKLEIKAGPQSA